jgi:ribosomal protein S18 acetylase RimI-like enzyme
MTPDDSGEKLKRATAGRYVSGDGRFTVEQSSGRWMAVDAEATDELGLPLVRGPFATLDDARAAIAAARSTPATPSALASKIAGLPKTKRSGKTAAPKSGRATETRRPTKPPEPDIELRDFAPSDGDALRALWKEAGFRSVGDDDRSLAAFAKRSPGLLVVATADGNLVGSALGGWDGRRGWIYHVATARAFRRTGIASRLVRRVEQRLRVAGAPKVNAVVRDENKDARAFWEHLGYERAPTHQFGRKL